MVLKKLTVTPTPNPNRLPNPNHNPEWFSWFVGALRAWSTTPPLPSEQGSRCSPIKGKGKDRPVRRRTRHGPLLMRKMDANGSVTTIRKDDLESPPTSSLLAELGGKVNPCVSNGLRGREFSVPPGGDARAPNRGKANKEP
jgi:hypothetical protein